MAKGRFKSFDGMLSEANHETVTIRVYGKDYVIPAVVPAFVPLMLARYEDEPAMQSHVMNEAAILMFGSDAIGEWIKHRTFGVDKLNQILIDTVKFINGEGSEDDEPDGVTEDEGGKPAPK